MGRGINKRVWPSLRPPGHRFDDFDWRISIAEIVRPNSTFSSFPGIDRILAVLEGKVALTVAGRAPVTLDALGPALEFPRARGRGSRAG